MAKLAKGSIKKLLAEVNGRCFYCGCKLFKENTTYDHIIPRSKGGNGKVSNIAACCFGCNGMKRVYNIEEFREIMERTLEVNHYEFHFEKINLKKV